MEGRQVQSEQGSVKSGPAGTGAIRLLHFVAGYVRANFQIALEYRAAFWAQVLGMALNDAMWLAFWALFFQRFQVVRGYEFRDVVMVWSVAAFAFGLATGLFGNSWRF